MNYFITTETQVTPAVRFFLGRYHYLTGMPRGCRNIFMLWDEGVLVGVACFGKPVGKVKHDLELKRFCLSGTVKNTGSWFIAKCIKQLKKTGVKSIISYADPEQGHEGTLYKAANFKYLGKQAQGTPYYRVGRQKVYARNVGAARYSGVIFGKMLRMKPKLRFEYIIDK